MWFYVLRDKRDTPWRYLKTTGGSLIEEGRLECDVMTPLSHRSLFVCVYISGCFPSLPLSVSKSPLSFTSPRHHVSKPVRETRGLGGGGGGWEYNMLLMVEAVEVVNLTFSSLTLRLFKGERCGVFSAQSYKMKVICHRRSRFKYWLR